MARLRAYLEQVLRGAYRQMARMPALFVLIALGLGIFLQNQISHSLGYLILGCGLCFVALALGLGLGLSPMLRQSLLLGSVALSLLALGSLRAGYEPRQQGHKPPRSEALNLKLDSLMQRQGELSPEVRQLSSAMALGYIPSSGEAKAMRHSFALSGAAHLLAVSGYHLALVVGLLSLALRSLRGRSYRLYALMLIAGAWAFTALTGWAIPTERAALMLTLYYLGQILGRVPYLPNTLALSAVLLLVYRPSDLYSWSAWLSYTAVLSIYLYYQPILRLVGELRNPLLCWAWQALALTLAAQVLTLPLVLHLFGFVSLSFILVALPLALLSSAFIPLALVAYLSLALGLSPSLLTPAVEALGQLMLSLTSWASSLDLLVLSYRPPLWALLLAWGAIALITKTLNSRQGYTSKSLA